jgi:pimeloyl-ACP methyl ester carboxylesterase
MINLRDQGNDIVAFEGPGQGGALEDAGLAMTPDWQLPVGAIIDRLSLSGVTLIGISLGGCLAIRAAAHESRVSRVVAWDALSDFLETYMRQVPPAWQATLRALLSVRADTVIDAMVNRSAHNPGPGMGSGAVDACIWRELARGGGSSSCQLSYTGDLAARSSRRTSPGGCKRSLHTGAPSLRSGRPPDECTVGNDPNVLEGRECTGSLPNRQSPAGDSDGHRLAGSAPEYSSGLTGSDTWVLNRVSSGSFGTFKTPRHVHPSVAIR